MFVGKGRAFFAVWLVLVLAVPALGVLAAGNAAAPGGIAAAQAVEELHWTLVHQAPEGQYFYGIYFPTKDVGYAVSGPDWNEETAKKYDPTYISKTIDGGKTWISTAIAGTQGWMRGITCTDVNNCWIAGKAQGRILRTTDGGVTWKYIVNVSGYPNWLWSIGWTGKGSTILAGTTCYDADPDPLVNKGSVANWLRSTDGQTFNGILARPGVTTCWVQWDIECPAPGVCYSTGKDYTWRSDNDGVTWQGLLLDPRSRQYGLSCTGASTCWVVGKSPWVRSTTNYGKTWAINSVAGLPTYGQFWDVSMIDNQTGYAVGCDNVSTDNQDRCLGKGVVYKTEDGLTWLPITPPTTAAIMDVWSFGAESVFVIDWSGKIWHGVTEPPATSTPTATATPTTGFVSGFAFDDLNGDAFRGADEPGLAGATLVLRQGLTETATIVTGADGSFRFTGIQPGQYTLEEKLPPPGYARSPFLSTFEIQANQELVLYIPFSPDPNWPTPTPTATETATPTATPTATATRDPAVGVTPSFLPMLVR